MEFEPHVEKLLSVLGYKDKEDIRYYSLEKFSSLPSLSHLSRIILRINHEGQNTSNSEQKVYGAYLIETNASEQQITTFRPVVFVAKANDLREAREIHWRLWLSASAPLIIVILPNLIKVYTGFDFDRNLKHRGLIEDIPLEKQENLFGEFSAVAQEALHKYSADAIDTGSIWDTLRETPIGHFNYENKVDKKLLRELKDLEQILLEELSTYTDKLRALKLTHSLIGKYVYFSYLHHRKIITRGWAQKHDIDLDKIFHSGATKAEFLKLDRAIENVFGGKLFPFQVGLKQFLSDRLISLIASVFRGDSAHGQRSLFLDIYDFSYIPVETLSYIYEQFLRSQGLYKKDGAVYTPESLADYLINEIHTAQPLQRGMKILDPCCGSGIFLVLTYRYLVELELHKRGVNKLTKDELRKIMVESIHGVELNLEACYVTEFSLILIMLNYIDPPDLKKNEGFKFPNLHDKNIFHGNFFDPSNNFYPTTTFFDWIIGNPPMRQLDSKNPDDKLALDWVKSNGQTRPVGERRIEEAFAWRAAEFLSEAGFVGFVLSAKRLFNTKARRFRQEFFKQNEVYRVTNFANFHYILFQADVSVITIVYKTYNGDNVKRKIWHYSPFVANQIAAQIKHGKPTKPIWSIVINKSEINLIDPGEIEAGEAMPWKIAFWGSYRDKQTIARLKNTYSTTLGQLGEQRGWHLSKGLELRDKSDAQRNHIEPLDSSLFENLQHELLELDADRLRKTGCKFQIPDNVLIPIPLNRRYFRRRGGATGLALIAAPHVVVNTDYAIYSDKDFIIKGQIGIKAPSNDADFLKAISAYLNSSLCQYMIFFDSSSWGIDRTSISPEVIEHLPIPNFSESQIKSLAKLQNILANKEQTLFAKKHELQRLLDNEIESILKLPESVVLTVHDFMDVKLSLNKGKTNSAKGSMAKATETVTESQLKIYAQRLRNELDEFTETGRERHFVSVIYSSDLVVCSVSILKTRETQDVKVEPASGNAKRDFLTLRKQIQKRFSQWSYIQRELRFFDNLSHSARICKAPRVIDWTESQALDDANDIITDVLDAEKLDHTSTALSINNYDISFTKTQQI